MDQDAPEVAHWVRQPEGSWSLTDYSDLNSSLTLPSLGCTLSLAEIYEDIDFTAQP